MHRENDLFMKMCNEATEELASGKTGWRDAPTNILFLACFGMLNRSLSNHLVKPLWFFGGSVFAGVITYILIQIFLT